MESGTGNCPTAPPVILQKLLAELLSTFILVFAGCGSIVANTKYDESITHLGISIAVGLAILIGIYTLGHISGAHMNPAVTLGFATIRHLPWKEVPAYITGQIMGSILAAAALRLIFGEISHVAVASYPGKAAQAVCVETLLTFILVFVITAVVIDNRSVKNFVGLVIAATVCMNVLFAGPVSGASMNPARSIGPAIIANQYRQLWVYIVGPFIGGVLGAITYKVTFHTHQLSTDTTEKNDNTQYV